MKQDSTYSAAFNGIVMRYYEKILKFCWYALGGDTGTAEDCAQDVFLVLYQNMAKLRDYDKIGGWLYKTASNITKQYAASLRKERKHTVCFPAYFENGDASENIPAALVYAGGVPDEKARLEEENAIDSASAVITKRLKPADKMVLRLAFKEKRPLMEVATLLDISLSAVKSRVSRLRRRITVMAGKLLGET
ncbi:MAG: sigma-70 family RNA polymerase sigma factor [Treponema sp.]|jgi:RNA polymerase sigma factor (sigma-70 family)|nr:sigma-70 family RNA polymerase sigma factor [Treponema sp.]